MSEFKPELTPQHEGKIRSWVDENGLDDSPYRLCALGDTFQRSEFRQPISLVDSVMFLMLEDNKLRIDAILTFDHDFANICYSKGIRQL